MGKGRVAYEKAWAWHVVFLALGKHTRSLSAPMWSVVTLVWDTGPTANPNPNPNRVVSGSGTRAQPPTLTVH